MSHKLVSLARTLVVSEVLVELVGVVLVPPVAVPAFTNCAVVVKLPPETSHSSLA